MDRDEVDANLRDIDEKILDKLEEYPCTRQHLAEELGVSGEYIYQRIDLLSKLGLVEKIHDGFYEQKNWRKSRQGGDER
jgi:Mn-dependent DtxR family transcriptional regulator